ncbi:MAG: T9SS type A sorting domain-containing protein [Bacteroidota bacterium]
MKKYALFFLLFVLLQSQAFSQFSIGHRSLTWQDPARSNRDVPAEVYYPATTAGENTSVMSGTFPVIVFGHGFMMSYSAYAFWKDNLVPIGYIMVFPTNEGGMSPDHGAYGADLAFILNSMKSEGNNNASPFYQKIAATSAIAGHSMGGGASFLACSNNSVPTCMFNFAAAETTPSAITAAAAISIPSLVISGADDCVAVPADNQLPMFNALASTCKSYISINNGAHCYFADYNFTCTVGESTCNPVPSINRADQLDATLDVTVLFLDYFLKNQTSSWSAFTDSVSTSQRLTGTIDCSSAIVDRGISDGMSIYPNPATDRINITTNLQAVTAIKIMNTTGAIFYESDAGSNLSNSNIGIDCSQWPRGIYLLKCTHAGISGFQKIVVE